MNTMKPLLSDIQKDIQIVNACLESILICTDDNKPPSEQLASIKEWAIEALKRLPINNNDIVTKYS